MSAILFAQFIAFYAIVLYVNYILISCLSNITALIGSSLLLLALSWHLTKHLQKFMKIKRRPKDCHKNAVLITGCDSGFGNRLAFKLNSKRFMVYATVLNEQSDGSLNLVENCAYRDLIKVFKMDVTRDEDVSDAYELVCNDLRTNDRQLWGLVNNAGISTFGPLDWGSVHTYTNVFDVNVFGLVRVTRTFLPLIRQSKGRIVNVSSIGGKLALPFAGVYSMSKHCVNSFCDALRRELQTFGIHVSLVMPCSAFTTHIIDNSLFCQLMDNLWNVTDNDVKQVYGQQYFDNIKRFFLKLFSSGSDNIDLVIDAIIHALLSNSPKISYEITPDSASYLINLLLDYIPNEITDKTLIYFINKL